MGKLAIVYGSSTDNTKNVAEIIADKLSKKDPVLLDVSELKAGDLDEYPNLILGSSTWGDGELQDDWDGYLSNLENANLEGKTIALFGVGDSFGHPDTFADAMRILFDAIQDKGANIIGRVSTDGYSATESIAALDGEFVGLPIDEDNEDDQTEGRVSAWVEGIQDLFQ